MIALAVGLALVAAVLHASWNVLLKAGGDPLAVAVRAVVLSALAIAPVGAAAWFAGGRPALSITALWLAAASAVLEVLYLYALSAAYRLGDLSSVYPTARGTAPVLAAAAGVLLLGERLGPAGTAAVAGLIAGIWLVRPPFGAGRATVPALLTGVWIAAYTTVDTVGVSRAPPWLYGWTLWSLTALFLLLWRLARGAPAEADVPPWGRAGAIGMMMVVTYLLVLLALSVAPLAVVAPARESAVVLVTAWGVWKLREPHAGRRLAGAAAILLSLAVLAATG